MGAILVFYEVITGEWGAVSVRSFQLNGEKPEDVIHRYFDSFWEDRTVVDVKAAKYHHDSWEQIVKISTIRKISEEEAEVLEKLGI